MIYFDNAATTRALPAVAEKMSTMLCEQYGNPASVSAMGLATTGRFTARQRAIKDRDSTLLQRKLNTLR